MIIDEAINYANSIIETEEFKEFLELKKKINNEYGKLIVSFKNLEAKYLEASKYKDYYPNFKEIQQSLVKAKAELYSLDDVKRYFSLERSIQEMLDKDTLEIKESISSHFVKNSGVTCRK